MANKKKSLNSIFLDANVIVKVLDGFEVPELFEFADTSEIYTSAVCFNIIAYLWEIGKIDCSKDEFNKFFASITLLEVGEYECFQALEISNYKDIEDGIQILCAQNNSMDMLLTYDKKMFTKYHNNGSLQMILCK
ncbi:MAG: hypothetical protein WCK98_05110 [bacterium]